MPTIVNTSIGSLLWKLPATPRHGVKDIADLTGVVRRFVRLGFRLDESSKQIIGTQDALYLGDSEFQAARDFLQLLAGNRSNGEAGRDYAGSEVSEAEVQFTVGTHEEQEADKARSAARKAVKPRVLRLSEQDEEAIRSGMPSYVLNELAMCARRVVQAPTVVFQGLRLKGALSAGRAYCGKPKRASDNSGKAGPAPAGMVYCVYTDPEDFVFDWDWVPEEQTRPGYPENYRLRFANQITAPTEAVLVLPSNLTASDFKKKAWHSQRGDCMFFYAADKPAYAKRVNEDLTEYRAFTSDELVGCKVKNFSELLSRVARLQPAASVRVSAVLAASLVRQMEDHQQRERSVFLRLIAQAALRMDNDQRNEFFGDLINVQARPEEYVAQVCDMVLRITRDPSHPMLQYVDHSATSRRAIEEPYLNLIAQAGDLRLRAAA